MTAPRFLRFTALGGALLISAPACNRSPYPPPPPTRRVAVVDTLHGFAFPDPYRWLEDQKSEETAAWVAAQNAYADSIIDDTPSREAIARRLRELRGSPTIGRAGTVGPFEYFSLRRPGEEVAAIYRRPASAAPTPIDPKATYQKLVDPLSIRSDGTTSVGIAGFSPDHRLMIYGVRDGGPDEASIHVRNLATGKDLPDSLPWGLYDGFTFDPGSKGFYYVHRSRQVGPRLKYHRLRTDAASDSVLFGAAYGPAVFLEASFPDNRRWCLFTVGYGWARNDVLLQDLAHGGKIIPIAQDLPAHFAPSFVDGKLWMRTDLDAPRGRVVVVDPLKPARGNWKDVIPQGDDVLEDHTEIGGKLYVTYLHNVSERIAVLTKGGQPAGEVPVPDHASASIRPGGKGKALLTISSLTQPSITYEVDLATGKRSVWQPTEVPFDSTGIEVRQVWSTPTGGIKAPIYLMYRRSLPHDGNAPTLLYGYGGFEFNVLPRFDPTAAVWVEHGGIFAQATLRGGNEFGETWHKDGMLSNKQHVFDDFLSAAQWLVDSGYTNPRRLAIRGVSNGGLLMGAAITQRPDLFRAAFIGRPDLDMVRFYQFTTANNAPALFEYGDASDARQFPAIRQFSPYQNVRDGAPYPAVMFDVGFWDTRVPPWQARKMAARLQAATRSGLPVIFSQDPRSGHAGGRTWSQGIDMTSRELEFLLRMVGAVSDSTGGRRP